jgi:hypothetical protein
MNPSVAKEWKQAETGVFWGEIAPSEHIVQIYENDDVFINLLAGFISHGFDSGDTVIIIATAEHLKALNQRLKAQNYDLFSLTLHDQYIPLNAEETLAQFMINGWPDEHLFYHLLNNLLLRSRKRGQKVRAFGEMVAILWKEGFGAATVQLEELWNRFCRAESFGLFCAYPKSAFTEDAHESLMKICNCHSKVVSSSSNGTSALLYKNIPEKMAS